MAQYVPVQTRQHFVRSAVQAGEFVELAAHHADDRSGGSAVAHHVTEGEQETVGRQFQNVVVISRCEAQWLPADFDREHRVILEAVEAGLQALERFPQPALLVPYRGLAAGNVSNAVRNHPKALLEQRGRSLQLGSERVSLELQNLALDDGADGRGSCPGFKARDLTEEFAWVNEVESVAVNRDLAAP